MAEDKKRSNRLWLWLSLGIILVIVFFVTRSLLREHLAVRVAEVGHEELRNTISTNGRVEPISNYALTDFHHGEISQCDAGRQGPDWPGAARPR
jgi:hypothetical protein